MLQVFRTKALLALCLIACSPEWIASKEYVQLVKDWELSGVISDEKNDELIKPEDLQWHLVFKFKSSKFGKCFFDASLTIDVDRNFLIKPKPGSELPKAKCVIVAVWKGAIAKTDEFQVGNEPVRISKLSLKFGDRGTRCIRARFIDLETSKQVSGLKVLVTMDGGTFGEVFDYLNIGTFVTDENGEVNVGGLPEGRFQLIVMDGSAAQPNGIWAVNGCYLKSQAADATKKMSEKEIPSVFWIPWGKAVFWQDLRENEKNPNSDLLAEGTILEFKASEDSTRSKFWDPKLTFQVTVGQNGFVKTPIVPAGIYQVKSVRGSRCEMTLILTDFVGWNRQVFEKIPPAGSAEK